MQKTRSLHPKFSIDEVRKELNKRKILDRVYEEIMAKVKNSSAYKELKEISMNQFINIGAQHGSNDANAINQKKIDTAKIGLLALSVDNVMQAGFKESKKNVSISLIKDICTSIVSERSSKTASNNYKNQEAPATKTLKSSPHATSSNIEDKHIYQSLHRLTAGSTANLHHIKQHVDEIGILDDCRGGGGGVFPSIVKIESDSGDDNIVNSRKIDLLNFPQSLKQSEAIQNLENMESIFDDEDSDESSDIQFSSSSDSEVSSVSTSDLSSYDDEISISSEDEAFFGKKRMSLKEATEISYSSQVVTDDKETSQSSHSEKVQENEKSAKKNFSNAESPRKELPQRKRKQNPKYNSEDILSYVPISSNVKKKQKQ